MYIELPKIYIAEKKTTSKESNINVSPGIVIENESGENIEFSEHYLINAESLEEAKEIAKKNGIEYDSIYLHPAHKRGL